VVPQLTVHSFTKDSAAADVLKEGDVILAADGTTVTSGDQLRDIINAGEGAPVSLTISRDGGAMNVSVTPRKGEVDGETKWLLGITLLNDFSFPIDVTIQLNNVGGPSAGMMFALGIIDTLTPGELNGGQNVAGTGTISADGTVGPIGGIQQKLYGARDGGARWFLAPSANCNEVVGHVPDGLSVVKVSTFAEARSAVEAIAAHQGDTLPRCTDVAAAP
jgi:PDZ domain-containing protein